MGVLVEFFDIVYEMCVHVCVLVAETELVKSRTLDFPRGHGRKTRQRLGSNPTPSSAAPTPVR